MVRTWARKVFNKHGSPSLESKMIAHLCIHKGDFAAEASIGLAACQKDTECEGCGGLGCQNSVLCTDRKHRGAAVDHLNAA